MTVKQVRKRKDMTPVERAILSRERGIERMRLNIKAIQNSADRQIAEIQKRISEKQFFLDALKRGSIKP